TGKATEAEPEFRRALEIQEKLAADHPAVTEFRSRLANCHNNLGNLLSETGKATEAEPEFRRALEIRRKLAPDTPKVPDHPAPAQGGARVPRHLLRPPPRLGRPRRGPRRLRSGHPDPRGAGPGGPDGPDVPQPPGL